MGVCINHELLQREKHIKQTLDRTEKYAEQVKEMVVKNLGISMMIRRISKYQLLVDIGGCETLAFNFVKTEQLEDWTREYAILLKEAESKNEALKSHAERMKTHSVEIDVAGNELYISRSFCKTQYGKHYQPARLPAGFKRGKVGDCFDTSILNAAMFPDYKYVEGMAAYPYEENVWIMHAWLTDGERAL